MNENIAAELRECATNFDRQDFGALLLLNAAEEIERLANALADAIRDRDEAWGAIALLKEDAGRDAQAKARMLKHIEEEGKAKVALLTSVGALVEAGERLKFVLDNFSIPLHHQNYKELARAENAFAAALAQVQENDK